MTSSSRGFIYSPLDDKPGAFRLLRLKKGTGVKLEAELIYTTADEAYDCYEAISYTWGDSARQDDIYIDDQPLGITYNLSIVLHDLRLPDTDRVLWNDATCINQEDLAERGQQVQQMGKFYSNAKAVLFYIGQPTGLTDFFMDALNAFWKSVAQASNGLQLLKGSYETDRRRKWQDFLDNYQREQFMVTHRMMLAYNSIMAESWFSRVWVIQEVFNARRGFVYCGQKHVPADIFGLCATFIGSEQEQIVASPLLEFMAETNRDDASQQHQHRPHLGLRELITTFSASKASDQYDRIYALLSMATDNDTNPASLTPDYRIDSAQVIINTIGHICQWPEAPSVSCLPLRQPFEDIDDFIRSLCNPKDPTLLLWAAKCGYAPVVQYMLDQGCDPTIIVESHDTEILQSGVPICCAAEMGHNSVVKVMVAAMRASGTATAKAKVVYYADPKSPLHYATENGHAAVCDTLLARSGIVEVDGLDSEGFSPLMRAAAKGHATVVKVLLATGAVDVNRKDKHGDTPLALAAALNHEAVVEQLLATAQVDVNSRNVKGYAPLHKAAESGAHAVVEKMLATARVDANMSIDCWKGTPLHLAVGKGNVDIVKLLLDSEKRVDLKPPDYQGWPLLHMAAGSPSGGLEVMKILLATGQFHIDEKHHDITPLSEAVYHCNEAIVELLINSGTVDVNVSFISRGGIPHNDGTVMDLALSMNEIGIAKLLLMTGKVDVHKKSTLYPTPWVAAQRRGQQDLIDVFYQYKYV